MHQVGYIVPENNCSPGKRHFGDFHVRSQRESAGHLSSVSVTEKVKYKGKGPMTELSEGKKCTNVRDNMTYNYSSCFN